MNLEEIKAREQAATPGPWIVVEKGNSVKSQAVISENYPEIGICSGISIRRHCADFIAHARADIPALIAEVERLNEQHQCDAHNIAAMKTTLDQQAKNCEELIESYKKSNLEQATENYELEQESATLKKALELACMRMKEEEAAVFMSPLCLDGLDNLVNGFIHQAQEQEADHA